LGRAAKEPLVVLDEDKDNEDCGMSSSTSILAGIAGEGVGDAIIVASGEGSLSDCGPVTGKPTVVGADGVVTGAGAGATDAPRALVPD
jgi:hypothetical protein